MSIKTRALLLSAGFGTRLRPLTDKTPKCLVEIQGEPIIQRWLHMLESVNCESAIINTHYLHDQVEEYIRLIQPKFNFEIQTTYEPKLCGTAGTLVNHREHFESSRTLLIHTDNATSADLQVLIDNHLTRPVNCELTMLTFETDRPSSCGIVELDSENIVKQFHEKVANPPGNIANGAVYVFDPPFWDVLDGIEGEVKDFSNDVIPQLVGRINTCHTEEAFIDIGTPENLARARELWPQQSQ